jgi:lipoprotein-anchoring transpeptidase ErfK/SrfK
MISLSGYKSRFKLQRSVCPSLVRLTAVIVLTGLGMTDLTGLNLSLAFGQSNSRTGTSAISNKPLRPVAVKPNPNDPNNARNNFRGAITQLKRSNRRWIEVRIRSQKLYAWQGDKIAFRSNISAGKSDSPTPTGLFTIQSKHNTAPMRGEGYNIPDVPFVMYYDGNYAIHGAYWHRKFGVPVSRGCVNLDPDQAARLFRWADVGTPIVIRE